MHRGGIFPETRGEVSIRGLWESQTEAIIGVRFGDSDVNTWKLEEMDQLLDLWGESRRTNMGRLATTNRDTFICL